MDEYYSITYACAVPTQAPISKVTFIHGAMCFEAPFPTVARARQAALAKIRECGHVPQDNALVLSYPVRIAHEDWLAESSRYADMNITFHDSIVTHNTTTSTTTAAAAAPRTHIKMRAHPVVPLRDFELARLARMKEANEKEEEETEEPDIPSIL
jgi:hypothetical protein